MTATAVDAYTLAKNELAHLDEQRRTLLAIMEQNKPPAPLAKGTEQRYVLGVAYQSGPDPLIKTGADGSRDYFPPDELEAAAWQFMKSREAGLFHADATNAPDILDHVEVVESYIYRGPDWELPNKQVVKAGDWLIGAIVDEPTWNLVKTGKITGWSPQGVAKRRKPTKGTAS